MELSGLSSAVAHEIKNPLSTIYLAVQVLRSDSNCNPRYIQIIEQEIERLNRIVNEFRSVSRPIEPRIVECNLRELVRKVIESIKGIRILPPKLTSMWIYRKALRSGAIRTTWNR